MYAHAASWQRAWDHLHLVPPQGVLAQVVQAYGEPQRHYHTVQHLDECLEHFAATHTLANHPGEVALALWFHDAVYGVQAKDNEHRSAQWAADVLTQAGASPATVARVVALIEATRHDVVPSDADQQLLVDIDLTILGATPARFAEYDQQVRQEYAWVPHMLYAAKRKEVLHGFLARPQIYSTAYFHTRYEAQARANLQGLLNA